MSEKLSPQPKFFYKVENNRINNLGDEFSKAFTPDPILPQSRQPKF